MDYLGDLNKVLHLTHSPKFHTANHHALSEDLSAASPPLLHVYPTLEQAFVLSHLGLAGVS